MAKRVKLPKKLTEEEVAEQRTARQRRASRQRRGAGGKFVTIEPAVMVGPVGSTRPGEEAARTLVRSEAARRRKVHRERQAIVPFERPQPARAAARTGGPLTRALRGGRLLKGVGIAGAALTAFDLLSRAGNRLFVQPRLEASTLAEGLLGAQENVLAGVAESEMRTANRALEAQLASQRAQNEAIELAQIRGERQVAEMLQDERVRLARLSATQGPPSFAEALAEANQALRGL